MRRHHEKNKFDAPVFVDCGDNRTHGLCNIGACAHTNAVPTFTPTSTSTPTPIPPTNTPLPADTPTPAPTQSINSLYKALRDVVDGKGVLDAAAYDKNKPGIHPVMLITEIDDVNEWNSNLPAAWRPVNLSQTELVTQITYQSVVIQTKKEFARMGKYVYYYRIRLDYDVVVREAKTGAIIASTTFRGGDPPPFPVPYYGKPAVLYGASVPYEVVWQWLKAYVEP